ncbi:MAG: hypothetical protein JO081_06895 [Alphaproteobacteria bacterium]|nr:hypothetical protein [Alphaproteobacteria bacterium]
MLEPTDDLRDFVQPSLLGAFGTDISAAEKADALARLRQLARKSRRGLEKQRREFEAMYDEASRRLPSEGLVMLAERVRQGEAGARELLDPWMDALRQAQLVPNTEGQRYIQELLDFSGGWLALYQEVRKKLFQLAAERRPTNQILRARPVEGEVGYGELSREHIARYPKIRARLAE